MPNDNTPLSDSSPETTGVAVADGRKQAFGIVFRDDLLAPEFAKMSGVGCKVYITLLAHASGNAEDTVTRIAFPTQRTIARLSGVDQANISRAIQELAELGYVEPGWRGKQRLYTIKNPWSRRSV